MPSIPWNTFLKDFNCNPPEDQAAIEQFQTATNITLPEDYSEFLRHANGGEGFVGEAAYVILWPIEEIQELNEAYEVEEFAPGLILFGSSGGGEAYASDLRDGEMSVVQVPFVGMELELVERIADSFSGFLDVLYRERDDE